MAGDVFNNPFRYQDPDGWFTFAIPLFTMAFDFVVTWAAAEAVVGTIIGASLGWGAYEISKAIDEKNKCDPRVLQETLNEEKKKGGKKKGKDIYAPTSTNHLNAPW